MNKIANNTIKQNNTMKQSPLRNNTPTQAVQMTVSVSNMSGIIILIVVLIAVVGSSYWLYNYYSTRTFMVSQSVEVLSDVTDATGKINVSSGTIPSSNYSNEYSISLWMNVVDYNYNYGKEKVIIRRGNAGSGNPEIVLDSKKNDLIVRIKLQAGTPIANSLAIPITTTVSSPTVSLPTVSSPTVSSPTVSSPTVTFKSSFTDILMKPHNNCGEVNIGTEEPYYSFNKFEAEHNKPSIKVGDNTIDYPTIQYTMGTGENSKIINELKNMPHDDTITVSSTNSYFDLISGNNVESDKKESFYNSDSSNTSSSISTSPNVNPLKYSSFNDHTEYNDPTIGICKAKMIPLQKWVNVIVSVYNQVVDIYIDGQLTSSCVLKGFPDISTADVNITPDGGFSGNISRVKFMNTAMTVQQARSIYYDGPIKTNSLFSIIPSWAWWSILVIIVTALLYSFFA